MAKIAIFILFILMSVLSWWLLRIKENKLIRLTKKLKANPSNQTVLEYITIVKHMKIPKKEAMFWGHLREAYEVVLNSTVDESVKHQFRSFLQQKGAKWAR